MVFVQSLRGLSHTKLEDTKPEHLELCVRALDSLASKTLAWLGRTMDSPSGEPDSKVSLAGRNRLERPNPVRLTPNQVQLRQPYEQRAADEQPTPSQAERRHLALREADPPEPVDQHARHELRGHEEPEERGGADADGTTTVAVT